MKNLPKEIYLNVGDIGDEVNEEVEFNELATGEVTWSREKIFDHDIKYVLYESLPHERVVIPKIAIEQLLEIIKDESEKANIRKYTCANNFGYSQFERNIARRILDQLISNFSE